MKNSILILGTALVFLTNVCNATNSFNKEINSFQEVALNNDKEEILSGNKGDIIKPAINPESEVFYPETVITYNRKTIEQTIDEADKIIENNSQEDLDFMNYSNLMRNVITLSDLIIENSVSNEVHPLYIEKTIEDEIAQLDMIIENVEVNENRPLDFKIINKNAIINRTFNSKNFVGMK